MNKTAIAWTDHTWNLFSGCKKISEECKFCYADTLAERHRGNAAFPHGFDLTVRPHKLAEPARAVEDVDVLADGHGCRRRSGHLQWRRSRLRRAVRERVVSRFTTRSG